MPDHIERHADEWLSVAHVAAEIGMHPAVRKWTDVHPVVSNSTSADRRSRYRLRPIRGVMRDTEIFAPAFPMVAAGSEEEIVKIANNTKYGLNAAVFSKNIDKAFTLAARLKCGLVVVNGPPVCRPCNRPRGGYNATGIGREALDTTIEEMTHVKGIAFRPVITDVL